MALPFTVEQFYEVFRDYNTGRVACAVDSSWRWPGRHGRGAEAAAWVRCRRVRHPRAALGVDRLGLPPGLLLPHQSCRLWLRSRLRRRRGRVRLAGRGSTPSHLPLGVGAEGHGGRSRSSSSPWWCTPSGRPTPGIRTRPRPPLACHVRRRSSPSACCALPCRRFRAARWSCRCCGAGSGPRRRSSWASGPTSVSSPRAWWVLHCCCPGADPFESGHRDDHSQTVRRFDALAGGQPAGAFRLLPGTCGRQL